MDLHCLLAPRRQTIQFPLPAPYSREGKIFLVPHIPNPAPPEPAAQDEKLKNQTSNASQIADNKLPHICRSEQMWERTA
jgi:hypothetical protein